MRSLILLMLGTCTLPPTTAAPTEVQPETANEAHRGHRRAKHVRPERDAPPAPTPIVAPARSADELAERAGLATFLEDEGLTAAAIDGDAMERWFTHPPQNVFLYLERPVAVAEPGVTVRGECRRVKRWDSAVINELAVSLWQDGTFRTVLHLGQGSVVASDQGRDEGDWETHGGRRLPMKAIVWGDDQIRYSEGAQRYEVACVHALREVSCSEEHPPGSSGYCVDEELEIRPWQAPMVPHVGPVTPGYPDPVPDLPEGDCAVDCERSACREAQRSSAIPFDPLYEENAPVLAAFRNRAACRAFAKARAKLDAGDDARGAETW